jgi:RHS repeat-associated protein
VTGARRSTRTELAPGAERAKPGHFVARRALFFTQRTRPAVLRLTHYVAEDGLGRRRRSCDSAPDSDARRPLPVSPNCAQPAPGVFRRSAPAQASTIRGETARPEVKWSTTLSSRHRGRGRASARAATRRSARGATPNMQGRIYDPTVGRFMTADPIVQSPFWSQGLNRYAYVFNSPMNLVDPSGFSAIGDYFQGLNDAPPEQAVPGYIGTGLVAGLAVMAVYEGVSASFAAGTASTVSTAATQSGGLGSAAPAARGAGAATVAIQRIKAATEDSVTRETGEVPTRSGSRPASAGKAHATSQPQKVSIFDPKVGAVACGPATQACIRIAQAAQNSPAGRAVQRAADRYGPQIVNWLRTQGSNIASAVSRFVSSVGPAARGSKSIDPNRLNHIFGKAEHALDDFVRASGGREQASGAFRRRRRQRCAKAD